MLADPVPFAVPDAPSDRTVTSTTKNQPSLLSDVALAFGPKSTSKGSVIALPQRTRRLRFEAPDVLIFPPAVMRKVRPITALFAGTVYFPFENAVSVVVLEIAVESAVVT